MKRYARIALYFAAGLVAMAIAWSMTDVTGINLLKVGAGTTAIVAIIDYVL